VRQLGVGPAQVMRRDVGVLGHAARHTPWLVRLSPVRLSPLLTPRNTGPVVSPPTAAAHWFRAKTDIGT
jgi:hypothetical protein